MLNVNKSGYNSQLQQSNHFVTSLKPRGCCLILESPVSGRAEERLLFQKGLVKVREVTLGTILGLVAGQQVTTPTVILEKGGGGERGKNLVFIGSSPPLRFQEVLDGDRRQTDTRCQ